MPKSSLIAGRGRIGLALAGVVAMLCAGLAVAQGLVVFSAGFDQPGDVSSWTFRPDPGSANQGGEIRWSGTEGLPAGSLELVNPGGGPNTVRAFSVCLPFAGDRPWTASVDAMPVDDVICDIDLVDHFTPDCSDERNGSSQGPGAIVQGEWAALFRERPLFDLPSPDPTRAIRFQLATSTSGAPNAPGSCVFDNIVITGTTTPLAAPALGPLGLALLAGALGLLALWFLRSR